LLGESDIEVVKLLLPSALAIPGAAVVSLTAVGQLNNPQAVVALATVADDALDMLLQHVQAWLQRANQPHMTVRPQIAYPFGAQAVDVSAAGISTIISAPLNPQSIDGLVLTVAFERTPEANAQRALQVFLKQVEPAVESVLASSSGRADRGAHHFHRRRLDHDDVARLVSARDVTRAGGDEVAGRRGHAVGRRVS